MWTLSISVLGAEKHPSKHLHILYHYVHKKKQFLKLMKFFLKKSFMPTTTSHTNSIPNTTFMKYIRTKFPLKRAAIKLFKSTVVIQIASFCYLPVALDTTFLILLLQALSSVHCKIETHSVSLSLNHPVAEWADLLLTLQPAAPAAFPGTWRLYAQFQLLKLTR